MNGDVKPTPRLVWEPPKPSQDPRTVTFKYQAAPEKAFEYHAGDGKYNPNGSPSRVWRYTYENTGYYTASARKPRNGDLLELTPVVIRAGHEPDVTIEASDPDNWNQHKITFPTDNVNVRVPWRITIDDGDPERVWAKSGETHTLSIPDGSHEVHVADELGKQEITIPVEVATPYDPDFALSSGEGDDDPTGMSTYVEITQLNTVKTIEIDWGDGSDKTVIHTPAVGHRERHFYTAEKNYWITVTYQDGTGNPRQDFVAIPWVV